MSLIINTAQAATTAAAPAHQGSGMSFILLWVGLIAILYFLMWRPQSKRMKAQKKMLESLSEGDEVVTSGGLAGRITKVTADFIVLSVAEGVDLRIQKHAVTATLPKGSLKAI